MTEPQTAATHLGKYEIIGLIGEGATASVYHARDSILKRDVALKILKPALIADPVSFARFAQEAQSSASIFHSHIAAVLDMGESQGRYFIVMQYVPGLSLDKYLRENGPLPVEEILRMSAQIGEALDFIHKKGYLHRDVKPSNIMRTSDGEYILTDFGLLRAMMSTGLTSHTGAILGTPSYIAPEIWLDQPAAPATDQYALACVVVEALTGKILFTGETPPAVMTSHVLKGAQLLESDSIPKALLPVLRRALAKDLRKRYPDIAAFHKAMQRALQPRPARPAAGETPSTPVVESITAAAETFVPAETPSPVEKLPEEEEQEAASETASLAKEVVRMEEPAAAAEILPVVDLPEGETAPSGSEPEAAPQPVESEVGEEPPVEAEPAEPRRDRNWIPAVLGVIAFLALAFFVYENWYTPPAATPEAKPAPTRVQSRATEAPNNPVEVIPARRLSICQVTDTAGIDDRSFSASVWSGLRRAETQLDVDVHFLQPEDESQYAAKIETFVNQGCDLIIATGFRLAEATSAAAEAHPEKRFVLVDAFLDPPLDNVTGLTFKIEEAAFLAGNLAARATQTGTVATYGGIQIPTVTAFMDGFVHGVQWFNKTNQVNVQVVGWNPEKQEGMFVGNFESIDDGRTVAQALLDEGADIIFPVAGPVGLGTAEVVQEKGNAWVIGVDTDWTVSAPEYKDVVLTSVEKRIDVAIFDMVAAFKDGSLKGGNYTGSLSNGGVGLSPLSERIPAAQRTFWDETVNGTLRDEIINGKIPLD